MPRVQDGFDFELLSQPCKDSVYRDPTSSPVGRGASRRPLRPPHPARPRRPVLRLPAWCRCLRFWRLHRLRCPRSLGAAYHAIRPGEQLRPNLRPRCESGGGRSPTFPPPDRPADVVPPLQVNGEPRDGEALAVAARVHSPTLPRNPLACPGTVLHLNSCQWGLVCALRRPLPWPAGWTVDQCWDTRCCPGVYAEYVSWEGVNPPCVPSVLLRWNLVRLTLESASGFVINPVYLCVWVRFS